MSKFARLLIAATLSIPVLTRAETCQLPTGGPVTRVLFKSSENCAFAEDLAQALANLSRHFPQAPPVTLIIGEEATNASFDNGHIIWLPQVLISTDQNGQIQKSQRSQLLQVVVHEYGHALLNIALKRNFATEWGALYDSFASLSTEAEQNILEKITPRGIRRRGGELAQTEEFQLYYKNIPAYSELYSDTLTVFAFNDLSAMKKALHFARQNERKALQIQLRDFANDHRLEDVEKANDPHSRLSLVRSYLGKKWKTLNLEGKRQLLFALEDAIVRALKADLKRTTPLSTLEMNQQLIDFLEGHSLRSVKQK